jgi:UDP-N-acetyl-2-amino-2-deoxyglucuronate dehydrogenase
VSRAEIGYAIAGAGAIGAVHAAALADIPRARLAGVYDPAAGRAQQLAATYGAVVYPDLDALLSDADVNAVCICTPSGLHMEPAVAAAAAGKHLVVEKPLDATLARADEILRAARKYRVKTTCILPYRSLMGAQRAKDAVAAGRLGTITMADARVPWWRSQSYYASSGWRGTVALDGGGALINQALHAIDLLLWLTGPAESVFGHTATRVHEMETEDTGVGVVQLKGGGLATIAGSTGCWPGFPATVTVHGDGGTIVLQEGRVKAWRLMNAPDGEEAVRLAEDQLGGSGSADPGAFGSEMHRRQLAEFTAAIIENRAPQLSAEDGRECLAVIAALYESAATGRSVRLAERSAPSETY